MQPVRPFRPRFMFSAACLRCAAEIESLTLPVPDLCEKCEGATMTPELLKFRVSIAPLFKSDRRPGAVIEVDAADEQAARRLAIALMVKLLPESQIPAPFCIRKVELL